MKILLPVDGSDYSKRAAQYLCKHTGLLAEEAQIVLLHVQKPLPPRVAAALSKRELDVLCAEEAHGALRGVLKVLNDASLRFKTLIKLGEPGTVIASHAEKGKFNLIVMGAHGHGALKGLVMGSVTTKVMAACKVPVLIVR